jgi:phosphoribosylformimino-5-aminoimidazole carboxamide ribotide isomerase
MMAGPSWEGLAAMTRVARLPIVASGGVTTLDDIRRLGQMRVSGCIIGRALYEGTIRLAEALQVAGDLEC